MDTNAQDLINTAAAVWFEVEVAGNLKNSHPRFLANKVPMSEQADYGLSAIALSGRGETPPAYIVEAAFAEWQKRFGVSHASEYNSLLVTGKHDLIPPGMAKEWGRQMCVAVERRNYSFTEEEYQAMHDLDGKIEDLAIARSMAWIEDADMLLGKTESRFAYVERHYRPSASTALKAE